MQRIFAAFYGIPFKLVGLKRTSWCVPCRIESVWDWGRLSCIVLETGSGLYNIKKCV